MSITAIVENGWIKLPMHLPDGTRVEVVCPADGENPSKRAGSFFESMREVIGSVEGPPDWAVEHDHYVHRTSKRGEL